MATGIDKKKRTTASMNAVSRKQKTISFKAWVLVIVSAACTGVAFGRIIQVFIQPLFDVLSALLSR